MWLIRFHNIQSNDYTKIKQLCKKAGFSPKKFSATLLVKCIITHILLKKSWRKTSAQFGVPYLPIYHFYKKIEHTAELKEILLFFCHKKIISYILKKNISQDFLESDELIQHSLDELHIVLNNRLHPK